MAARQNDREGDREDDREDDRDDDRIVFRVAATPTDLLKAMVVRGIVFHDEQGVDWNDEFDADDTAAVHVV
ncbi:hypothetical protein FJ250_06935, partial [bacterium]|nr:hypothetical protein [bacterium]